MTFDKDPDPHHLLTDPDSYLAPDPALFVSGFQAFLFITRYPGTFTSVFKDKKSESHKTIEIKVLFTILLDDGRVQIRSNNDGSGGRVSDPDPD